MKVLWRKLKRGLYHITHGFKWSERGLEHLLRCEYCKNEYNEWIENRKEND